MGSQTGDEFSGVGCRGDEEGRGRGGERGGGCLAQVGRSVCFLAGGGENLERGCPWWDAFRREVRGES